MTIQRPDEPAPTDGDGPSGRTVLAMLAFIAAILFAFVEFS